MGTVTEDVVPVPSWPLLPDPSLGPSRVGIRLQLAGITFFAAVAAVSDLDCTLTGAIKFRAAGSNGASVVVAARHRGPARADACGGADGGGDPLVCRATSPQLAARAQTCIGRGKMAKDR